MFYQVRKILVKCLVLSLFSVVAFASDEAKHDDAAKAATSAPPPVRKSSEDSYSVVLGKVQALEAKVKSGEDEIQKLVTAKGLASNPQQVNEIIKNMLTLHHDLKKNIQDYERQRSLLKYRYPEKSQSEGREYERLEVKSLEEMEGAASLSASIRHTLKKVRVQFPVTEKSSGVAESKPEIGQRSPASQTPALLEPVLIKK